MAKHIDYTVRVGSPNDATAILNLIKELCLYEKESLTEVVTTEKDLLRDGLQRNEYFHCLVVETNSLIDDEINEDSNNSKHNQKSIIGFALYYFGYSTWKGRIMYLEDLFVKPELRGAGVGTALLKKLCEISEERNCARMMWVCLYWNTPAKEFYKKIGSEEQSQWNMYYFNAEQMKKFRCST